MKGRLEASFGRAFGFRVWGQTGFIRIYKRVQGSIIRVPPQGLLEEGSCVSLSRGFGLRLSEGPQNHKSCLGC